MRKNMIMIGAGMMLALTSCNKTEIREMMEDRVVPQPVDTIKVDSYNMYSFISSNGYNRCYNYSMAKSSKLGFTTLHRMDIIIWSSYILRKY